MNTILLALALLAGPAQAGEIIATMPNQAGGEILLTRTAGGKCLKTELILISRASTGPTFFGCWSMVGNLVLVRWQDGDTSSFPSGSFTVLDDKPAGDSI